MVRTRRRRRLPATGVFAILAPIAAVSLTSVAFIAQPGLLRVGAIVGAVASAMLGAVVFQLHRRLRADIAAVRASQAAAYDAIHARYSGEHREFTAHMVGLLDLAEERLTALRRRLNEVQARLGAGSAATSHDAADAADGHHSDAERQAVAEQWDHLWLDLSELPTVVELLSWEERSRHGLLPEGAADEERKGDVQTA